MGLDDGDYETLTSEFPLSHVEHKLYEIKKRDPTKQELRWRKIGKLLKKYCNEGGIEWSGKTISLVNAVREEEVRMFQNEEWPYIIPYETTKEKAIVLQTVSFPNHLYNWLSNERILITVLYRLRNYIMKKWDKVFYELMETILNKVKRQHGILQEEDKEAVHKALRIGKDDSLMIGSIHYDGRVF
jgi:hypothetical protein